MKRIACGLVVAGLMASQVRANDAKPEVQAPPVDTVIEVTTLETQVNPTVVDPVPSELPNDVLMTMSGPADDQVLMNTAVDGEVMHTMTLGGDVPEDFRGTEQEMMTMNALGLPGLGGNRINLNTFGLFGEHRDQMRLPRDGQAVTTRKVGLLQFFSRKGKSAEATVRTVSTTERARAQKMAEIDALRDDALRTGDRAKLAQADKLEAQLNSPPAKTPSKFKLFRK